MSLLDRFFIDPASIPANAVTGTYDMWLVGLSFLQILLSAYLAITIVNRVNPSGDQYQRHRMEAFAAITLGIGIWSMHFTGMLAYQTPVKHDYDLLITILSALPPILFSGWIFHKITSLKFSIYQAVLTAPFLGLGIACMHYMGMYAMEMKAYLYHTSAWFWISIMIAIIAAAAAMALLRVFKAQINNPKIRLAISAIIAVAACGLHYSAMQAVVIIPMADCEFVTSQSNSWLVFMVIGINVVMNGASLLWFFNHLEKSDISKAQLPKWHYIFYIIGAVVFLNYIYFSIVLHKNIRYAQISLDLVNKQIAAHEAGDPIEITLHHQQRDHQKAISRFEKDQVAYSQVILGFSLLTILLCIISGYKMIRRMKTEIDEKIILRDEIILYQENLEQTIREQTSELVKAKEVAEQASEIKSNFLANMTHELRTPLNSILGMLFFLRQTNLKTQQEEMVETINESAKTLLELVNDVLDYTKMQTDEFVMENIGLDLQSIIQRVCRTIMPIATQKGIRLTSDIFSGNTLPYVLGDPLRISQVVTNLLSNAVKYTTEGSVTLTLSVISMDEDELKIKIEVVDTGIGIPAEKLDTIFEKFSQIDASNARKFGGTGLGLAITRNLARKMGGDIIVKSILNKGSIFTLTLPLKITDKLGDSMRQSFETSTRFNPENLNCFMNKMKSSTARILVTEDHKLNQIVLHHIFKRFGIKNYTMADNGIIAMEKYRAGKFDIILMDCHMPGLSGYDVSRRIRDMEAKEGEHYPVPIIAMTANAMAGDSQRCFDAGMTAYIPKPINIEALRNLLGEWLLIDEVYESDEKTDGREEEVNNQLALIDLTNLKTFSDGDHALEVELVKSFLEQSNINIADLENAVKEGDDHKWVEASHMLKGGAGNIGAEELRKLAEHAQNMKTATYSQRAALYGEMHTLYQNVVSELKKIYEI